MNWTVVPPSGSSVVGHVVQFRPNVGREQVELEVKNKNPPSFLLE